jgi:hypothetical protein
VEQTPRPLDSINGVKGGQTSHPHTSLPPPPTSIPRPHTSLRSSHTSIPRPHTSLPLPTLLFRRPTRLFRRPHFSFAAPHVYYTAPHFSSVVPPSITRPNTSLPSSPRLFHGCTLLFRRPTFYSASAHFSSVVPHFYHLMKSKASNRIGYSPHLVQPTFSGRSTFDFTKQTLLRGCLAVINQNREGGLIESPYCSSLVRAASGAVFKSGSENLLTSSEACG